MLEQLYKIKILIMIILIYGIFFQVYDANANCTGNGTNNVVCDTAPPNPFLIPIITTFFSDTVEVQTGSMVDASISTLLGEDIINISGEVDGLPFGIFSGVGADDILVNDGAMVSGELFGILGGLGGDTINVTGGSVNGTFFDGINGGTGEDQIFISNATVSGGVNSVQASFGDDTVTLGDGAVTMGVINGSFGTDNLAFTQTVPEPECTDLIDNIIPSLNPDDDMVTINGITYNWINFETLTPNLNCSQPPPPVLFKLDVVPGEGCMSITGPGINCGFDCSHLYPDGTIIMLVATPEEGYEFDGWGPAPDCVSTNPSNPSITLNIDHNITCQANCKLSDGPGEIDIVVEGEVDSEGNTDEEMPISLTPAEGMEFADVEVEVNFPEGIIVNDVSLGLIEPVAQVNEDEEEGCVVVNETQIHCFIRELAEQTFINVNIFVPDLGGEILLAQLFLTTETVPGATLDQFLEIIAGRNNDSGDGNGGCSISNSGTSKNDLLIFALIPAAVLLSRMRRK